MSQPTLQSFDFDVVTVNHEGQQISRSRGQAQYFTEVLGNGIGLEMVLVPGGSFLMGSSESEAERDEQEGPQHLVTIPTVFVGKYPVTQAQWKSVATFPKLNRDLKPDSFQFEGANHPVDQVSWEEATEFCDRLSQSTQRQYRLPTEAEWEYACRAGTTTPFHFGETITTELANYRGATWERGSGSYRQEPEGCFRDQTTDVGSFPPNAFGLYDMHGSVNEWCLDYRHTNYEGAPTDGSAWVTGGNPRAEMISGATRRIMSLGSTDWRAARGGSWDLAPKYCRSAQRFFKLPFMSNSGFRIICTLP